MRNRKLADCFCGLLWGAAVVAGTPRPPVFPALDLGLEGLSPGEILLGELHCTACHAAPEGTLARLAPKPAPVLGEVAALLEPSFVRAWLLDPQAVKPGTTMPEVLHRLPPDQRAPVAEALTHFLWAVGTNRPTPVAAHGPLQRQQGRVLYHQTGCVACHPPYESAAAVFGYGGGGPTDPEAVRFVLDRLGQISQPLPNLAAKYTPLGLAEFLHNPLAIRPGGRMPSFKLTPAEASAIAAYLRDVTATTTSPAALPTDFTLQPDLVRRGGDQFAALGCAACHALGSASPSVRPEIPAPSLAELDPQAPRGCLAPDPRSPAPRYRLSPAQRDALLEVLGPSSSLREPLTPARRVLHALARFDCYACHARDGYGGPSPSRSDFFNVLSEFDLGDEGRLPPHLGGVGKKLRLGWLGEVLTNAGVVRPYMAVRMPQFGAQNVGALAAEFVAADASPDTGVAAPAGDAVVGGELVGVQGYSCVTCHSFGPHPSLGISVMDMTQMARRLNWDWFRRYLLDPGGLRPGTRMPAFWPDGEASVPSILGGDTDRQIAAIWSYLALGPDAPPPPGLLEHLERVRIAAPDNGD